MVESPFVRAALREEGDHPRDEGVVGAREDGEADAGDVLLDGRLDDHLGRLAEAGVDDLEALVAEAAGEHLCATVMAVEAGLGDQDLDRAIGHGRIVVATRQPASMAPPAA